MRDDNATTVGIRALLRNTTTTPYNVYRAFIPESIDFVISSGTQNFITYRMLSEDPEQDFQGPAERIMIERHGITAYSRSLASIESIHRRIKTLLQHKRSVTNPTSSIELNQVKLESEGPPVFDDVHKIWTQEKIYRAWGRDDRLY